MYENNSLGSILIRLEEGGYVGITILGTIKVCQALV